MGPAAWILCLALGGWHTAEGQVAGSNSFVSGVTTVQTNAVPGWLSSVSRSVVLDVEQDDLTPACRGEAGVLVEAVLGELLNAHLTVFLSPHLLESELAYYRKNRATETNAVVTDAVVELLEKALRTQDLDWPRLRELHARAPDGDVVTRHLPWLSVAPDRPERRLASVEDSARALLTLKLRWSGIPMQGIVAVAKHHGRGAPGLYTGHSTLWRIEADLCLRQSGTPSVRLSYPAPAWKSNYEGISSRPLFITRRDVLNDLKTGAAALPEPDRGGPPKKRTNPK